MQICVVNDENMQVMSWGELMIVLLVLGITWYGYVVLKYYPHVFKKEKRPGSLQPVKWVREVKSDTHTQVHELMQEIKLIFVAAVKDKLNASQIKEAIGLRLSKYISLPDDIKFSVNQHIVSEFSLQLKMNVNIEEINSLWKS